MARSEKLKLTGMIQTNISLKTDILALLRNDFQTRQTRDIPTGIYTAWYTKPKTKHPTIYISIHSIKPYSDTNANR